jgi:hypothetical protein
MIQIRGNIRQCSNHYSLAHSPIHNLIKKAINNPEYLTTKTTCQ